MSWLEILVVIGVIGFVIYQQVAGQVLQGKRVLIMLIAGRAGAHIAASTTPLLFTLGLNRLGQAAVIVPRAMMAGIPFAPEKDGSTFGSGALGGAARDRSRRY